MKRIISSIGVSVLVIFSLFFANFPALAADNNWLTDFEQAKIQAEEKGMPILALFTAPDWCYWCKTLEKEVLSQPAFQEYAKDNLVLFQALYPSDRSQWSETARILKEKYMITGFPTVLLLDAEGNTVPIIDENFNTNLGYRQGGADKYVELIKNVLQSYQKQFEGNKVELNIKQSMVEQCPSDQQCEYVAELVKYLIENRFMLVKHAGIFIETDDQAFLDCISRSIQSEYPQYFWEATGTPGKYKLKVKS